MTTYHLSPTAGVAPCHATQKPCRYGGESGHEGHYATREEAQAAYEEQLAQAHGGVTGRSKRNPSSLRAQGEEAAQEYMRQEKAFLQVVNDPTVSEEEKERQRQALQRREGKLKKALATLNDEEEVAKRRGRPTAAPGAQVVFNGYTASKGHLYEDYLVTPRAVHQHPRETRPLKPRAVTLGGAEGLSPETKAHLAGLLAHYGRGSTTAPKAVVASKAQAEDLAAALTQNQAAYQKDLTDLAPLGAVLASGQDHTLLGVSFAGDATSWNARTKRVYYAAAMEQFSGARLRAVKKEFKFLKANPTWEG